MTWMSPEINVYRGWEAAYWVPSSGQWPTPNSCVQLSFIQQIDQTFTVLGMPHLGDYGKIIKDSIFDLQDKF